MPAQPALEFIPPQFTPWLLPLTRTVILPWLKSRAAITDVEVSQGDRLVDLYHQFQQGNTRLLLAFRHPSADDPVCLFQLIDVLLPRMARAQGKPLQGPTHFHFLYDRGIPLWAGEWVSWFYSRLGGISIFRGKLDLQGLRTAREILVKGQFPLAAAPEGATNGHNELVSPIEPGVAQLGVWCVEDLQKAGRNETVLIVPVGIRYHYSEDCWQAIADLLVTLESDCGLTTPPGESLSPDTLYSRLLALATHLLAQMELFYRRFYHRTLPEVAAADGEAQPLGDRLQTLLNLALQVAEEFFGLQAKGTLIDRCRRLEQAGWDWIYREDLGDLKRLSLLERGLADRIAEEAELRLWHMRLVETFVSVTGNYVREKPTAERFAETALLLWDLLARLKGDSMLSRPKLGARRVQITIGEPLVVNDYLARAEGSGRRASRQAVEVLTQDLQLALEQQIPER